MAELVVATATAPASLTASAVPGSATLTMTNVPERCSSMNSVPASTARTYVRSGRPTPVVCNVAGASCDVQPGVDDDDTFRVYLDPAGHPFCLCWD